jgi:hypothetical protein
VQFTFALAIDNEGRVIVQILQHYYDDGSWRLLGSFDRRSAVDLGIDSNGNLVY